MDENTIFTLIGLAVLGYIVYVILTGRHAFRNSYLQTKAKLYAQDAAEGKKPVGKPWGNNFGSAYFMSTEQIAQAGIGLTFDELWERMYDKDLAYLMVGLTFLHNKYNINTLDKSGHILTIAPTRSGKGVSAVIPNILFYGGSIVINDVKGENYAVTSEWRRSIGHKVLKFAPFDDDTDFWNPFSLIDKGEDAWEDVRTFAELLLPERAQNEEFWNNEARNLLAGVILHMHITLPEEQQTMWHLRHLLTQDKEELTLLLETMASSENALVQRAATAFLGADEKVCSNVMSTLNSHMGIWDSPRLKHMMSKNSYPLNHIQYTPVIVYFSIPPGKLDTYAPVVRLFMGLLIKNLSHRSERGVYQVLFMLDEFPSLGRMKIIEEGMAYMAGYGVNFWLFAQDLKQLAATYGEKAESIIANCSVKQFFGVADYDTARLVSHMCGETTVPTISYSSETGMNMKGASMTVSAGGRPLLTPGEVMNFPADKQILFFQGYPPIVNYKMNYLDDPFFQVKEGPIFAPNPFHS